jgi:nucleotide-binding universal stress UspA family protein
MNVLIGTDGSACAGVAVELAAGLPWPGDSTITLLSAVDAARLAGPFAGWAPVDLSELESDLSREMGSQLAADAARFTDSSLHIHRQVLLGRPSMMLSDTARDIQADAIIVGNRGRGGIRSMLLGSVSAEVVDSAPCPVLVARGTHLRRILLANDGSPLARAAQEVIAAWPVFNDVPVEVLSVAHGRQPWRESLAYPGDDRSPTTPATVEAAAEKDHADVARHSAERLGGSGREVSWAVRSGDPARMLVEEAEARGFDLIVMGTHGRTGLDRLMLGSVARNVLTHAHCSVLIVPPLPGADRHDRD